MEKKHTPNSLMFFIILITYAVGLVMLIVYWGSAASLFKLVYGALEPFFVGMIIAYILNLPMRFLETKAFPFLLKGKKINPKLSRIVALLMSFLFVSMIIAAVIAILIPQISVSITTLISNFEGYLPKFYAFVENTLAFFHIDLTFFDQFEHIWQNWLTQAIDILKNSLPTIYSFTKDLTTSLVGGVINAFVGIIISFYILLSKEKLIRQSKKLLHAFLPEKIAVRVEEIAGFTHSTFAKFISGQLIEAFIIGVMCFIGMSILGFPYALLISVIVGATNVIPIVGPFIGAVPGVFIMLVINPIQALWFIIFSVVLQELESNLIYPHVVGNSVGLPGLWVMFAIFFGGELFGLPGIILGVPTLAVLYKLFGGYVNTRLKNKEIKAAAEVSTAAAEEQSDA